MVTYVFERRNQKPISIQAFLARLMHMLLLGILIIAVSLFIGIVGYRHFENMPWIDAYVNAAMILSGMGPVDTLHTNEGKIFAGSYALFSGIIFLVVIALTLAPIFHRFMHKFHLQA